ncbi:MAG TPA: ABC transporter ATP-binding protein [Bryobacteraceae bacterium]|nr:ABC transporter ATP-binding protein [Bryobacteraceae bacterium]
MSHIILETVGLRKVFDGHSAVDGLNLQVEAGSIFGFLGRNGAGKTTTIRILLGFLKAAGGEARLFGETIGGPAGPAELRRRIGFVSESKHLYPYMTVQQMIRFTRPFFPGWRNDLERRYLEIFDLPLNRKVSKLSKGMRTGLTLLLAMSHGAELLLLDEPTEGLDPAVTETVLRELVALTASEGTTIFFSSHHLAEVEQIADHVAIIERGRAVVGGALDDLKVQYQRLRIVFQQEPAAVRWVDGVEDVRKHGRTVSILASRNVEAIVQQACSLPGASVERYPVSLKDIFLEHVRSN